MRKNPPIRDREDELRTNSKSEANQLAARALRKHGFVFRLTGCFFSIALATVFVGLAPEANFIWAANGVMLAYLLLAPRNRWAAYLCTGYVAQFAGGLLIGHHSVVSGLFLTLLNLAESLIGALLLRRRSSQLPDFTSPAYIVRFIAYGVLAGPVIIGAVDALLSPIWHTSSPLWHASSAGTEFLQWVAADSLGVCVATPACAAIFRTHFRHSLFSFKNWALLLLVVVCAVATFSQARVPLPFLLYPLLVLVLLRLGLGWAALATLFVAGVASSFTVRGHGPFSASGATTHLESAILLQLFVAGAMVILYSVSVVIEDLRSTERGLEKIAIMHKLVTDNSRDIIMLADCDGVPHYISPAVQSLTGYKPSETMRRGFAEVIHRGDLPKMRALIRILQQGAETGTIEYRVKKKDGEYIWVEGSLRSLHDSGTESCTGILQIVRDISERKLAEQQLAEAYRAVEMMAITDALTGLANRRQFDQCLTTEWRRGLREHTPLSLLLIDADLFKTYNDAYGHLRGDNCLKQIAEAIQDVILRPGDLVARFGGEEFAVILPNTAAPGAFQLAQDICAMVSNRQLPHSGNPAGIVTISVGSATQVPQFGQPAASLIECADQALYQAKRSGRNRACAYRPDGAGDSADKNNLDLITVKSA
jgi:diguanylate cyclase (GGDEF)-like protein/PAS domain S-box-containing protein